MKLFRFLLALALATAAFAQTSNLNLYSNPPLATSLAVATTGTAGNTTYYYWVVTNYPGGATVPAGPVAIFTSNATLSTTNFNTVTWAAPVNAIAAPSNYDLLRTTTSSVPSGACACAVATAISGTSQTDQSNTLNAYTVNASVNAYMTMFLDPISLSGTVGLKANINGTTVALPRTKTIAVGPVAAAGCVSMGIPVDGSYQIAAVREVHTTASSSGTIMVERLTGTTAPGSGTNQLTGTISNAGAANTVLGGTVVASPATYAAGDRIGIVCGGTQTSLVGMFVTITLNQVN